MPKYKYKAYKEKEQTFIEGEVEATDVREAREKIRELGFLPTKVYTEEKFESEDIKQSETPTVNSLSLDEKIQFTSELEVLLSSQIPIIEALNMVSDNAPNLKIKRVSNDIRESIQNGSTLKEAIEKYGEVFDPVFIGLVTAGEMSGNIDQTFSRIHKLQLKQKDIKEKIISASIYPAILILMVIGVLFLFGGFILPRFAEMYMGMGAELPFLANMIYSFTKFMTSSWYIPIGVITALGYGIFTALKMKKVRDFLDKLALSIPYLDNFVRTVNLSNFVAVLSVAYEAGIPITQSTEMAATTIKNHIINNQAQQVVKSLNKGHTLFDAFNMAKLLDKSYTTLVLTGEKSGELGKMLNQLTDILDRKTETVLDALTRAFEPTMIIIMGIVVGFLLLAFYPLILGGLPM